MGLSCLPAASEGVLCVILVNTALSISIFKGIVRSILHIVGIRLSSSSPSTTPSSDYTEEPTESFESRLTPTGTYIQEFRSKIPTTRFDAVCNHKMPEHDSSIEHSCSVCLSKYEPQSEVNCLSCGHIFHKVCLEKWLDYWNVTCPLCRSPVIPEEETPSCFW